MHTLLCLFVCLCNPAEFLCSLTCIGGRAVGFRGQRCEWFTKLSGRKSSLVDLGKIKSMQYEMMWKHIHYL